MKKKKIYFGVIVALIIITLVVLFVAKTAGQKKIEVDNDIPNNLAISNELGG